MMPRMRNALAVLSLLAVVVTAAEGAERCASPTTQAEMNRCAYEELQRADAALNRAYQKVLRSLEPDRQKKLQAAERAWLAYRDAHCAFEASESEGGSIYPLEYSTCRTELTKQRTAQLRRQ
jgi:uncharacterized protein YecT (DUF1311 family)